MSGIYFGDRCSPVSSSAVLVASVTRTALYDNIKMMFRSAAIPFALTCIIYLILGCLSEKSAAKAITSIPDFSVEYELVVYTLIPAAAVLILAFFRVNVRTAITISCILAAMVCVLVQNQSLSSVFHTILFGYPSSNPELSALINGGGLFSMKKVLCIICISATYSGIIKGTNLTETLTSLCEKLQKFFNRTLCLTIISTIIAMIGCNQTLAIMLTGRFCEPMYPEEEKSIFANDLEDTVVMISGLIPWCIAGAVPLATVGAPTISLVFACYLYLLPLWQLIKG